MFSAVEVQLHSYIFQPFTARCTVEVIPASSPDGQSQLRILDPWLSYNPLHDMEALWWIAAYFLIAKDVVGGEDPELRSSRLRSQRMLISELFWKCSSRHNLMAFYHTFSHRFQCLHPSLLSLYAIISDSPETLTDTYCRVEENILALSFDTAVDKEVYKTFHSCFDKVRRTSPPDIVVQTISRDED